MMDIQISIIYSIKIWPYRKKKNVHEQMRFLLIVIMSANIFRPDHVRLGIKTHMHHTFCYTARTRGYANFQQSIEWQPTTKILDLVLADGRRLRCNYISIFLFCCWQHSVVKWKKKCMHIYMLFFFCVV